MKYKLRWFYPLLGTVSIIILIIIGLKLGAGGAFVLFYSPLIGFNSLMFYIAVSIFHESLKEYWINITGKALLVVSLFELSSLFVFLNSKTDFLILNYSSLHSNSGFEFFQIATVLSAVIGLTIALAFKRFSIKEKSESTFSYVVPWIVFFAVLVLYSFKLNELFYNDATGHYTPLTKLVLFMSSILLLKFSLSPTNNTPLIMSGILISSVPLFLLCYDQMGKVSCIMISQSLFSTGLMILNFHLIVERLMQFYKKILELSRSYDTSIEMLNEVIEATTEDLVTDKYTLSVILTAESLNELKRSFEEVLYYTGFPEHGRIAAFYENNLLYRYPEKLPEDIDRYKNYEVFKSGQFVVFYKNIDERYKQRFLYLMEWFSIKFKEIMLIEKLQDVTKKLKKEVDFRSNLMRAISHELKTPLNIIYGNVQLMEMGVFGDVGRFKEPLKNIRNSVETAKNLINTLLQYAKAELGEVTLQFRLVTFSEFLNMYEEYKYLAESKGLEFSFNFEGHEPFVTDPSILSTIISNLLSNAVKYTDSGRIEGWLKVSEEYIEIVVKDTGRGISKEELSKIFEPFYKKEGGSGSHGLGLALVKKFVEMFGGKIKVESEVGVGTKFTIRLPRIFRPTVYKVREKIEILIVDPNETSRKLFKKFMSNLKIVEIHQGSQAFLKILEHSPDFVAISLHLVDVSPTKLFELIKQDPDAKRSFVAFYGLIKDTEDLKNSLKDFASVLKRRVLIIYEKNTEKSAKVLQKLLEESENHIVILGDMEKVPEEEIEIYDSFVVIVDENLKNRKDFMRIHSAILKKKGVNNTAVYIFTQN